MMTLRIALVAALAVAAAAAPALAQRGPVPGGRPGWSRDPARSPAFQGITLTDAQRARIDSIHANAVGRMGAARARADSTVRAERMAAAAERRAAVRAVLTPEQQAVFDRNIEQLRADRERMRASRAGLRGGRPHGAWHRMRRW